MEGGLLDGRVDLIGAVGNDRRSLSEDVECVDEPVQAHGVGTGEPELNDLCGREVLAQTSVELVVHCVMVGREEIEELHGQSFLFVELRPAGATRQATSSSVIESCLRDCMQGWHSPSCALRMRSSSRILPPRSDC